MILETIYNHVPVWAQNVMCSVKGWQIQRQRFGKDFIRLLKKLEAGEINPDEELRAFLKAIRNVPAYSDVFKKIDDRVDHSEHAEDLLKEFPIINKSVVNSRYEDFINRDYKGKVTPICTSGTTGASITVPNSAELINRQWATWWRYRENLGIKFGTWCGWLACTHLIVPINERHPPFWRINRPGRLVMFSPYHLNAENASAYIQEIERRGLTWLHGFASNVRFLCRMAQEQGCAPVECVKFVTTGAENLLPAHIEDIKKIFPNAIVRTHYGQTEGVANFSQTKEGDWRVDDDFAHVEFIPVDPAEPSRCRIVGTSFSNPAFPLVRYDIGDIAIVEWKGGKVKVLGIEGRENEYFVMKDGTKISTMRAYDIFKGSHNVIEAQLRIHGNDHVELMVVKGAKYSSKDEKELLDLARKYLGNEIRISISYADRIERSRTGKFKAIIKV